MNLGRPPCCTARKHIGNQKVAVFGWTAIVRVVRYFVGMCGRYTAAKDFGELIKLPVVVRARVFEVLPAMPAGSSAAHPKWDRLLSRRLRSPLTREDRRMNFIVGLRAAQASLANEELP